MPLELEISQHFRMVLNQPSTSHKKMPFLILLIRISKFHTPLVLKFFLRFFMTSLILEVMMMGYCMDLATLISIKIFHYLSMIYTTLNLFLNPMSSILARRSNASSHFSTMMMTVGYLENHSSGTFTLFSMIQEV
jgi:hypothetical protein